jgi:hypothetical protein
MKNGMINEYGNKRWYKKDLLHREDGPAVIDFDGHKAWYFEGKKHRIDGPAVIYPNGDEYWWFEGLLHRTDGPAIIRSDGTKCGILKVKNIEQTVLLLFGLMVLENGILMING